MDAFGWGGSYNIMSLLLGVQIKAKGLNLNFLSDSWSIPFAFSCTCLSLQILHVLVHWINTFRKPCAVDQTEILTDAMDLTFLHSVTKRVKSYGGWTIYSFMVARLFGCLVLFTLFVNSFLGCQRNHHPDVIDTVSKHLIRCPEGLMTITLLYCSVMAMVSVTVKSWSVSTTRYNILVLLSVFGVYLYRDIWPLATVTKEPEDLREGYMLWIKFSITTLTAVIIPLFIPRQYVPVDPKNPVPEPNPEQTCSLFALVFYSYLDPVIMLGYRVPHLHFDQLPPLSDSDYSQHITKDAFPHLDPYCGAKRRHLFFGLIRVFRVEYMILSACLIGHTFTIFAAPIGINRLLNYLETGGADTFIRPWFWISWLFAGPIVRNLCYQWYLFVGNRTLIRVEGLLTQLVFEHSLRIRLKAEASNETIEDDNLTMIDTPDSVSIAEGGAVDSNLGERTNELAQASMAVTRDSSSDSQSTSKGIKGRNKSDPSTVESDAKPAAKHEKDAQNLIGKINNLVTTDLVNITRGVDFLLIVLYIPLQTILCIFFLYEVLGWSGFIGITTMLVLLPVPGYIGKMIQDVQIQRMKMTDARVQDVTEAVNVLRMIKLFGWEHRMSERIRGKRNEELGWLWKLKVLETLNGIINNMIPAIVMLVTYATYTLLMKQKLNASKIFSSLSVFTLLEIQLHRLSYLISSTIQAKVSLDRMTEFLHKTELLDSFADKPSRMVDIPTAAECEEIGLRNATFSWSAESPDGSSTPSQRTFRLHISGEQLFKRDCINLIIGPTGSGKTSILMALLGEMHFTPSTTDGWFNLPRNGGVAYAAQESWVQNDTIRNNILFGSACDEVRYRKVIHQCALERDLELFDAGDQTEVGERGLTLSGGQKARVTLARAIYSSAKILLLDDILAALDVHTSSWIINRCLRGDLVKDRTVLLVTHNVVLAAPIAQHVVSVGQDGTVRSQEIEYLGTALALDSSVAPEADRFSRTVIGEVKPHIKDSSTDGKLVIAEEIEKGHVTWKSMKLYLSGLGGEYPLMFFSIWISASFLTDWVDTFQVWFLGYWGSQYETHTPSEVNALSYLTQYSLILAISIVVYTGFFIWYAYGSLRASRKIGTSLVDSVLGSTLRWLDETPTARIIVRCTQDIAAVDGPIPQALASLTNMGITMLTRLVVVIIFTPIFLSPTLAIVVLGFYLGNLYLRTQLSVKREMSNARSPLLAHFSAAIVGLVSIRAYGAQVPFKTESLARLNHYIRAARMSFNLNRWIGVRIEILGATFTAALASYLVYGPSVGAGNTGFSLNMVVEFCALILWWVRQFNEFEVQGNSLERIQGYLDIEHEPKETEAGRPPAAWPASGDLRVENLSARYSQTGPVVLHDLSFHIKSGQRIGVVGRTGSGKSSLTLALLRCILTEGTVYYDGIPTNQINLDALRSNITIIPQTPELLSGTLRRNLDPFEQHDDATLNDVLHSAGLFSLQEGLEKGRLTLDSNISSGGGNLSVGQRQILALARAIVRGSKLLILDEATSAIDYKTDSIIQTALRHQMSSDVTIITVAHRLQTIMDADKIMVLDDGRIAEFDSPNVLLQKADGFLKSLVDGSGDKEALHSMADTTTGGH